MKPPRSSPANPPHRWRSRTAHKPRYPDIAQIVFILLALGLLILGSVWILRPFLPAMIWSTLIVVATWPLMRQLQTWLGNRRWAAVLIMIILLATLIVAPIGILTDNIANHAGNIQASVSSLTTHSLPTLPAWVTKIPVIGERAAAEWETVRTLSKPELIQKFEPYIAKIASWLASQVGNIGKLTLNLILTLITTAILYMHGEQASIFIRSFAHRLGGRNGEKAVDIADQAIRAVAMGIVVTAMIQTLLGSIGLAIAGVPYIALLTMLMFVFCIAQIGPGVVLFGATAWVYFHDHDIGMAIFLGIWSLIVTSLDNFIRPALIKRGANVPIWIILVGVLGGLSAFGILGLFIGPAVLAVSRALLNEWIKSDPNPDSSERELEGLAELADKDKA